MPPPGDPRGKALRHQHGSRLLGEIADCREQHLSGDAAMINLSIRGRSSVKAEPIMRSENVRILFILLPNNAGPL